MKRKDILLLLIPGFILTIFWIAFTVYHNHITPTISTDLQEQIMPINPSFNTNVIEKLRQRTQTESLADFSLTPSPSETQQFSNTPLSASTSSPLIQASGGGVLGK